MPKTKLYFSYALLNFQQQIIDIKCDYLKKNQVVVVVYLSICFQFNRKLPFEKYSAALFCRR
jgi:hypothetical protein